MAVHGPPQGISLVMNASQLAHRRRNRSMGPTIQIPVESQSQHQCESHDPRQDPERGIGPSEGPRRERGRFAPAGNRRHDRDQHRSCQGPAMVRTVLFMAVPWAIRCGGRLFRAVVVSGIDTMDTPSMSKA